MNKTVVFIFCFLLVAFYIFCFVLLADSQIPQKFINVPVIWQYPKLPTGCESVAATMVLQYYGEDITAEEFAFYWLDHSDKFYSKNGKLYGPDPNKLFVGNPFFNNSFGCFSTPIINAINHNSKSCSANAIVDHSLDELCAEYIDYNKPLLIWATMWMKKSYKGKSWYLEDNSIFTWTAQEHCLVLVGYNNDCYFLNDPMIGRVIAYKKEVVEKRFAELGNQAVYIHLNER